MRRPIVMDDEHRLRELQVLVDAAFVAMGELDFKEVANRTGLHIDTVRRLWRRDYGVDLSFATLQSMLHGAGLRPVPWGEGVEPRK